MAEVASVFFVSPFRCMQRVWRKFPIHTRIHNKLALWIVCANGMSRLTSLHYRKAACGRRLFYWRTGCASIADWRYAN